MGAGLRARHLTEYLPARPPAQAKEGQIEEGGAAWEAMSAGDRAKRKRSVEEKKSKLKSPNFRVSATRLSVRNVPRAWTEPQLRAAFVAAVKERATKAVPRVKQVKLLTEEAPGGTGEVRSKGIGFVEFEDHEHALCALRQLNNNPKLFGKVGGGPRGVWVPLLLPLRLRVEALEHLNPHSPSPSLRLLPLRPAPAGAAADCGVCD